MVRNTDTSSENGLSRRTYVTLGTVALAGVAGCIGGGDGGSADEGLSTPEETTETFYETLYADKAIEAANELYHPDSDSGIEAADFEPFGGIDAISSELLSTEIVSEDGDVTELHATVEYTITSDVSGGEAVDYLFLRQSGDQWLIDDWVPEAIRENVQDQG